MRQRMFDSIAFRRRALIVAIFFCAVISVLMTDICVTRAVVPDIGFRVQAIPPANQINQTAPWFQVNLKSGQKQKLTMQITNTTDKDITVYCTPTIAQTNRIGQIQYDVLTDKRDSTLQMDFSKIGPQKVKFVVPGKKTIAIDQNIQVPDTKMNGVLYGAFTFVSPDINKRQQESAKGDVSLQNQFHLTIPAVINVNDYQLASPDLHLERVTPVSFEAQPAVRARIHNIAPQVIAGRQMVCDARVYFRGSKKVLFRNKTTQMNFAPNSVIDYPISWGDSRMQPGEYTLRAKVTTGGGAGPSWNMVRNFTISGDQARKLNGQLTSRPDYSWLIIFLVLAAVLLIITIVAWAYRTGKHSSNKRT
ncbi:DUF916 and DUF3324 domain-containing protein [Schleiferilactobacillus perolens]|nr:DUF916 and DUF3324 domain-containing protein [Schleiferilactobacillus perolens]